MVFRNHLKIKRVVNIVALEGAQRLRQEYPLNLIPDHMSKLFYVNMGAGNGEVISSSVIGNNSAGVATSIQFAAGATPSVAFHPIAKSVTNMGQSLQHLVSYRLPQINLSLLRSHRTFSDTCAIGFPRLCCADGSVPPCTDNSLAGADRSINQSLRFAISLLNDELLINTYDRVLVVQHGVAAISKLDFQEGFGYDETALDDALNNDSPHGGQNYGEAIRASRRGFMSFPSSLSDHKDIMMLFTDGPNTYVNLRFTDNFIDGLEVNRDEDNETNYSYMSDIMWKAPGMAGYGSWEIPGKITWMGVTLLNPRFNGTGQVTSWGWVPTGQFGSYSYYEAGTVKVGGPFEAFTGYLVGCARAYAPPLLGFFNSESEPPLCIARQDCNAKGCGVTKIELKRPDGGTVGPFEPTLKNALYLFSIVPILEADYSRTRGIAVYTFGAGVGQIPEYPSDPAPVFWWENMNEVLLRRMAIDESGMNKDAQFSATVVPSYDDEAILAAKPYAGSYVRLTKSFDAISQIFQIVNRKAYDRIQ